MSPTGLAWTVSNEDSHRGVLPGETVRPGIGYVVACAGRGDHIPQWADTVSVYDRAKVRRPDRRHRITRTVVTVKVVQEDDER